MNRTLSVAALACLLAPSVFAQQPQQLQPQQPQPKQPQAQATPDLARFERFLRRYFSWPAAIQLAIPPFKPSPIPGLLETTIKVSHDGQQQEAMFYMSADGQYVLQGPAISVSADPFAANRAKMDLKEAPAAGSPLAQVTIVEYSDFQCGFCRATAEVLRQQVLKQFPADVRLVYRDFPLPQIHPWSIPAAALGRCIFKRYGDGFWDFHDWAFANQPQLTAENFKEKALAFAKEKGLDAAHLGACMEKPEVKAEVDRSVAEGQSLGVTGTPTMFINGRKIVGNQSFQQLQQAILTELDSLKAK